MASPADPDWKVPGSDSEEDDDESSGLTMNSYSEDNEVAKPNDEDNDSSDNEFLQDDDDDDDESNTDEEEEDLEAKPVYATDNRMICQADSCVRALRELGLHLSAAESLTPVHRWALRSRCAAKLEAADRSQKQSLYANCLDARDDQGRTPLRLCVEIGDLEGCVALLTRGAGPNIAARDGRTPLFAACLVGNLELLDALLRQGAVDWGRDWKTGANGLHVACARGRWKVALRVLSLPPLGEEDVVVQRDFEGRTCLHASLERFSRASPVSREICNQILGRCPALARMADEVRGELPLHVAARRGLTGCAARLVAAYPAGVQTPTKLSSDGKEGGLTPLLLAAEHARVTALAGWPPTDVTLEGSSKRIVVENVFQLLAHRGADLATKRPKDGLTAEEILERIAAVTGPKSQDGKMTSLHACARFLREARAKSATS